MRSSTGARKVVPITISRMAASSPGLSRPGLCPTQEDQTDLAPGHHPQTHHQVVVGLSLNTATGRNLADDRHYKQEASDHEPERQRVGRVDHRQVHAGIPGQKTVANKPHGVTAVWISSRCLEVLTIRPPAKAPSAASSPMAVAAKQLRASNR